MYENGHGVTKNIGIAVKWYQKAASNCHEKANESLKRLKEQKKTMLKKSIKVLSTCIYCTIESSNF
jgi:TPR repeat protein